jgi:outer membrane protein TolC
MAARFPVRFAVRCCALALIASARGQDAQHQEDPLLGPGRGLELTLDAAIEIALQNNLGLQIEALNTDVARYNYRATWGDFDWNLTAQGGVTDIETESQNVVFPDSETNSQDFSLDLTRPLTTGGTFGAHFDTVNTETDSGVAVEDVATVDVFRFTYDQPLWRGAWREYNTSRQREADYDYRRQSEREREISQRLLRDVSDAYWDLVEAREQLRVAESSLELARRQVDQNQRRLDAGVGTEVELLQAEAEVATREEQRLLFEVRLRRAMDGLKQLLFPGTDEALWETQLYPATPLPEQVTAEAAPPWNTALEVALESRSELRQQRLACATSAPSPSAAPGST